MTQQAPSPLALYHDPDNPGPLAIDRAFYERLASATDRRRMVEQIVVPIRTGRAWPVRAGQVCRIVAIEGPQVCDLNAWNLNNPRERFWAARSRQFQGAHVTAFDRLWSCLPYLRPMLTFTADTLPPEPCPVGHSPGAESGRPAANLQAARDRGLRRRPGPAGGLGAARAGVGRL